MTRICILGGGFAGLYTALGLARLPWSDTPEIVLIDQNDRFVFTPLLYELITGELQEWEIAPTFKELLDPIDAISKNPIDFMQGKVTNIDLPNQQFTLSISDTETVIGYDRLLIALGGTTPIQQVSGAANYALPFRNLADAQRLTSKLAECEARGAATIRVCVVGAGNSGVELACKISDRLGERGRVRLVDRGHSILSQSPVGNRQAAEQALNKRGVWVDLNTAVTNITATDITLNTPEGSDTLPVDLVVWAVGNSYANFLTQLPVSHHPQSGALVTLPTLQLANYPEVFVAGDVAGYKANYQSSDLADWLPATAQVAFQQASYAAPNIWATLHNQPLQSFQYVPLGEMMTLGMDDAAMSVLGKFTITGLPAQLARQMAYVLRMPTLNHQLKVASSWVLKPAISWFRNQWLKED
ncbi:MAG: NAD(P)/FAD-dependent oxidoreductase [Pseudanabaenaceae cyanobacterium]|jgi:NADH:ubiquinone reductase (non-electrogenic)